MEMNSKEFIHYYTTIMYFPYQIGNDHWTRHLKAQMTVTLGHSYSSVSQCTYDVTTSDDETYAI